MQVSQLLMEHDINDRSITYHGIALKGLLAVDNIQVIIAAVQLFQQCNQVSLVL